MTGWAGRRSSSRLRVAVTGIAAGLAFGMLAGCGGDSATTCDQFAALSASDQDSTLGSLLRAHDKEDGPIAGMSNRTQLRAAVETFCAISPMYGDKAAHEHNSDDIDQAADWN